MLEQSGDESSTDTTKSMAGRSALRVEDQLADIARRDLHQSRALARVQRAPALPVQPPPPETDALRAFRWVFLREVHARLSGRAVGWALSIFRDGQEVAAAGHGHARAPWEQQAPDVSATPDTRVHLASVSKPITATGFFALMEDWNRAVATVSAITGLSLPQPWEVVYARLLRRAIERWLREHGLPFGFPPDLLTLTPEEVLRLNDELDGLPLSLVMRASTRGFHLDVDRTMQELLGNRVSGIAPAPGQVTVRKLMRHESGLSYADLPSPRSDADIWSNVAAILSRPLVTPVYENGNFFMVRVLIEHLSGETYMQLMRRRVFGRAGVSRISCRNDDPLPTLYYAPAIFNAAEEKGGPLPGDSWGDMEYESGGYGLYASPREVARLFDAIHRDVVLKQASREQMHGERLGWWTGDDGYGELHVHNGVWNDRVTTVGILLPGGWSACLVANSGDLYCEGVIKEAFLATRPVVRVRQGGPLVPVVKLLNPVRSGQVRYTLDGTDPVVSSPEYSTPIICEQNLEVRACLFDGARPLSGFTRTTISYVRQTRPSDLSLSASVQSGVRWKKYSGAFDALPNFDAMTPSATGTMSRPSLDQWAGSNDFGVAFEGYLKVTTAGTYKLELVSDDGSRLWIGDTLVIDNDRLHPAKTEIGAIVLAQGYHRFKLWFFERGGGEVLVLKWKRPDGTEEEIPAASFSRTA